MGGASLGTSWVGGVSLLILGGWVNGRRSGLSGRVGRRSGLRRRTQWVGRASLGTLEPKWLRTYTYICIILFILLILFILFKRHLTSSCLNSSKHAPISTRPPELESAETAGSESQSPEGSESQSPEGSESQSPEGSQSQSPRQDSLCSP